MIYIQIYCINLLTLCLKHLVVIYTSKVHLFIILDKHHSVGPAHYCEYSRCPQLKCFGRSSFINTFYRGLSHHFPLYNCLQYLKIHGSVAYFVISYYISVVTVLQNLIISCHYYSHSTIFQKLQLVIIFILSNWLMKRTHFHSYPMPFELQDCQSCSIFLSTSWPYISETSRPLDT